MALARRYRRTAGAVGRWCGAVRTACGRLAGVLLDDGIQRKHRQLEHRVCVEHEGGMRTSAFGHYAARKRSADEAVARRSSRGADADQLVPAQMWRSIVEM